MTDLHTWIVFIHVAGVIVFLVAHGVSVGVVLRLRAERDPAAVRTLVELSRGSIMAMSMGALIWLVAGIVAGFTGKGGAGWWTTGSYWIWVSLVLAIVIIGLMTPMGRIYLNRIRVAVGRGRQDGRGRTRLPGRSGGARGSGQVGQADAARGDRRGWAADPALADGFQAVLGPDWPVTKAATEIAAPRVGKPVQLCKTSPAPP